MMRSDFTNAMILRQQAVRIFLFILFATVLIFTSCDAPKEVLPNFIIIYCDDLGYGDIGPYGNKVNRTPHLDQMAEEGVVFTDFYVRKSVV